MGFRGYRNFFSKVAGQCLNARVSAFLATLTCPALGAGQQLDSGDTRSQEDFFSKVAGQCQNGRVNALLATLTCPTSGAGQHRDTSPGIFFKNGVTGVHFDRNPLI